MTYQKLELKGHSILTLDDLSDEQLHGLIDLAAELKKEKASSKFQSVQRLAGKNIALLFQKPSTRTRCAAVVAGTDEGAHVEYLGERDIHIGKKESVADTARVLGRMFDAIFFRGFAHQTVVKLAESAGVPVWNGLTDDAHPTQLLADLLTVKENFGELQQLNFVYIGDGRNNVCNSLMLGCAKTGINFINCCPSQLKPDAEKVANASIAADRNGSSILVEENPEKAVVEANVIYTDVWVSMGEEEQFKERCRLLKPYQVNMEMMQNTGNIDNGKLIFLHCLPAFHNNETEYTREIGALEVTDDVFEAPFSKVFDQAENRMHTIKAMMVASLGE